MGHVMVDMKITKTQQEMIDKVNYVFTQYGQDFFSPYEIKLRASGIAISLKADWINGGIIRDISQLFNCGIPSLSYDKLVFVD